MRESCCHTDERKRQPSDGIVSQGQGREARENHPGGTDGGKAPFVEIQCASVPADYHSAHKLEHLSFAVAMHKIGWVSDGVALPVELVKLFELMQRVGKRG